MMKAFGDDALPDERLLYDPSYRLTDDDIRFFRDHPEELSIIDQRESFRFQRLAVILMVAICFFAGSKIITTNAQSELEWLLNSVLIDILFEMGAAMIGALATLLFLEIQKRRQLKDNLRLRAEIRRRMRAMRPDGT